MRCFAGVGLVAVLLSWGGSRACMAEEAMKVFRVETFGAAAGADIDSGPGIRKAIAAAMAAGPGSEVVLGPGVYRVKGSGDERYCFSVRGAKDLVIRGEPGRTEIVVTEPWRGCWSLQQSEKVVLRDFAVDYDPPPFTQGVIVGVDAEAGTLDVDIEEGFPLLSEPWFNDGPPGGKGGKMSIWGMVFDGKERRLKAGALDHLRVASWSGVKDRVWRIQATEDQGWRLRHVEPGDRFVHLARRVGQHAVESWFCKDTRIENVTVYASPGVAGVLGGNDGVEVRGLAVRFRPNTRRLLTVDADGLHCQQNRSGPIIEDCYFEGMADDSINIYAPPNVVREVRSVTELVTDARCKVRAGDLLQIMDPRAGAVRAEVKAERVRKEKGRQVITLERAVKGVRAGKDHREADTIYNLSACGWGYVIRNNHMRVHRRHGMLLRAGGGLVEGNRIEGVGGLGIVVTNEPSWPEGPMARDVVIRNNVISGVGYVRGYGDRADGAAIQIKGTKLGYGLADGRGQRHIRIEGNRITDAPGAAIYVGGAADVQIVNNRVDVTPGARAYRKTGAIVLENCDKVTIENCVIVDPRPETFAAVEIRSSVEPGKEAVVIKGLEAKLASGAVEVADKRERQGGS